MRRGWATPAEKLSYASSHSAEAQVRDQGESTCKLIEAIAGSYETFWARPYPSNADSLETPGIRRALYHIPNTRPSESRAQQPSTSKFIKVVAQKIMRWLLGTRVSAG
jgi:hypothetical protein